MFANQLKKSPFSTVREHSLALQLIIISALREVCKSFSIWHCNKWLSALREMFANQHKKYPSSTVREHYLALQIMIISALIGLQINAPLELQKMLINTVRKVFKST